MVASCTTSPRGQASSVGRRGGEGSWEPERCEDSRVRVRVGRYPRRGEVGVWWQHGRDEVKVAQLIAVRPDMPAGREVASVVSSGQLSAGRVVQRGTTLLPYDSKVVVR